MMPSRCVNNVHPTSLPLRSPYLLETKETLKSHRISQIQQSHSSDGEACIWEWVGFRVILGLICDRHNDAKK